MRLPILGACRGSGGSRSEAASCCSACWSSSASSFFTDDKGSEAVSEGCTPEQASPAAGNANVDARALGKGYARQIVIRVTDKKSGAPVHGAKVSVQGTMDCPHFMPLYQKNLREASTGTYKGDYQLIMQGHWIFHVVVAASRTGRRPPRFRSP